MRRFAVIAITHDDEAIVGYDKRMNDDDPQEVMVLLKSEHRRLDDDIERMRLSGNCDQLELARMKKRKLHLRDEIAQLADRITPDILA